MKIYGLQKMTLLDFPGKVACTVFLGGCNFRCPFCHNAELADLSAPPVMEEEELFDFLKKRQGLLEGVAVTGGEPLFSDEIFGILKGIKALGYPLKLDTDGGYPERLKKIIDEKLADYIAMDVKNSEDKYALTCGVGYVDMSRIRESISLIMNSGIEYEFRTTVTEELFDEDSFHGIGRLVDGAENYFIQPFKDRDTVRFAGFSAPSSETLQSYFNIMKRYVKNIEIRGADGS